MTDEEGQGVEGEGEAETANWRVRAGPRNKPTAREREEHEATHMSFRVWCTHCIMGRGRTHHHVSKKRSEDLSRRPITAMDNHFLKPNSTASSQTIPDESVTCIVVKEDRHLNICEQRSSEKGNRRTLGKRESGKIHQLFVVRRDHVEKRHRAGNNRVQKPCD